MAEKTQACIFPRGWGFALIISNYSSHIQIRTVSSKHKTSWYILGAPATKEKGGPPTLSEPD